MEDRRKRQKVIIVGAGPVGSLAALYAADRGHDVEVYELRDIRNITTFPLNFSKSINLAMMERGLNALRHSDHNDLVERILAESIPMYGRMIHGVDSAGIATQESQLYDVHGRYNNSIDRGNLNRILLDELGKTPNIKVFYSHKLTGADFRTRKAWFEPQNTGTASRRAPEIEKSFDFMIGADGTHSATRFHMMKYARVDYQQEYIDTLWCEFKIKATKTNDFAILPNHLHIWPGKEHMFIALPCPDKSFTCTLFAPSGQFSALERNPTDVVSFFQHHFPHVCPDLIPEAELLEQFSINPHLPLISLKCRPHHYDDSVVIVGDAAHAILPFYGQGLNAGLEDVRILFSLLDEHIFNSKAASPDNTSAARGAALAAYSELRIPDTFAINTLSRINYDEMRQGVTSSFYRLRKAIEETLYARWPRAGWATQYSRVCFTNQRYSEAQRRAHQQGRILAYVAGAAGSSVLALTAVVSVWALREGGVGRRAAEGLVQSGARAVATVRGLF